MIARNLVIALLVFCWATGCGPKKISDRDLVMIDSTAAADLIEGHEKLFGLGGSAVAVWVDPRSDRAYRQGHIAGAIHLPFQHVQNRHQILKGHDVLVVYGDDYRDPKAEGMSKKLLELGFKDVRTLRGGLRAWIAAGNDVETGQPGDPEG